MFTRERLCHWIIQYGYFSSRNQKNRGITLSTEFIKDESTTISTIKL